MNIEYNNKVKYFAELIVTPKQQLKVVLAKKLAPINQYRRKWKQIDAREFARVLNTGDFVIK